MAAKGGIRATRHSMIAYLDVQSSFAAACPQD